MVRVTPAPYSERGPAKAEGPGGATVNSQTQERFANQLKQWRDELINLSRTNRLVYFKHTKTASLEILGRSDAEIFSRIEKAGPASNWQFYFPEPASSGEPAPVSRPRAGELLVKDKNATELRNALRLLERKTESEFVDRGLWTLYLALGALEWIDPDDNDKAVQSPLLLIPVTFGRNSLQDQFRLRRTEDDPVINPALAVKLANEFDLRLPGLDSVDEIDPRAVNTAVAEATRRQPKWRVIERAVITNFSFHKEAMYRDLLDNEGTILENALVQMLALGPDADSVGDFDFDPPAEDVLDEQFPPEDLVSIRDADSSQRRCILAARDGRSFVADGPPGTGKSQTITNVIGELIHAGKSVLFVSEKAAALDVVYKRLQQHHLEDFVLELHSHKATRKAVAQELGRSLGLRPSARETFSDASRSSLIKQRQALSAYAQALNEIRQPLGRSLHGVLGRVAELQVLPHAPIPSAIGGGLGPGELSDLCEAAKQLARNWQPVSDGDDFLWRDLAPTESSLSRTQDIERGLTEALEALAELRTRCQAIDGDLRLGWYRTATEALRLVDLLAALTELPLGVPTGWLTRGRLDVVVERAAVLEERSALHQRYVTSLAAEAGDGWMRLAPEASDGFAQGISEMERLDPAWRPEPEATTADLGAAAKFLEGSSTRLSRMEDLGQRLAETFGLSRDALTVDRLEELAELGSLAAAVERPEPTWLNPALREALDNAARVLAEIVRDFRKRGEDLATVFKPTVLNLDLVDLHKRFTDVHRGPAKARKAYRADKDLLAPHVVGGKVTKAVRAQLGEAVAWYQLLRRLESEEKAHAAVLGAHYYDRESVDFDRVSKAIEVAHRAVHLAGSRLDVARLQRHLSWDTQPEPELQSISAELSGLLSAWLEEIPSALAKARDLLRSTPAPILRSWVESAAQGLALLESAKRHVEDATGGSWPLASAGELLTARQLVSQIEHESESEAASDSALLGDNFTGLGSNWSDLRGALSWTGDVREILGGPVRDQSAVSLLSSAWTYDDLAPLVQAWEKSAAAALAAFSEPRQQELARDLGVDFDEAENLLRHLLSTTADIEVWALYTSARLKLNESGLEPVTRFCETQGVESEKVPGVIERAILEGWADAIISADRRRLSPIKATERDALVESFRRLDAELVQNSAARIVNACSQRRPNSLAGAAGIINREAQKQKRHMPIRRLLSEAGAVVQQLKPCFMMSPLSVSQFLPADLIFDAVIFDEASQVRPSDAINCVYRGEQLIVAGDQNQLPPSSFFAAGSTDGDDGWDEDATEDFESVLELCKAAGGLRSLPLQWHYRSEHESLITYSNYKFYDGRLFTFPGSAHEGDDLGLEVIHVANGVYRRGGARDNPIEAAKVIDRVLHHRHHNPHLSIGVVTFSSAQEDAVVAELERRSLEHPELAELVSDDRLHGFFVKNLENVQGDERDLIIFSVGYGKDENGKFTQQMGPLNKQGGWRRLNVAITRAKRRVEVVTSVLPGDFATEIGAVGVRHLRGYIDFGLRGAPALALDLAESMGDAESPFEEEVIRSIARLGYEAVPQVGLAGYRIDIGVRDPRHPGRFLLAVECDGAMYHSSKVARDRDRLRQSVIEGLGWKVHRIWGISWFRDRPGQERRLQKAIEESLNPTGGRSAPPTRGPVVTMKPIDFDALPEWVEPYVCATTAVRNPQLEMHDPNARPEIRRVLQEILRAEAPIHEERLLTTLREAWGVGRAGHRIRDAVDGAVRELERRGDCRKSGPFLYTPGQEEYEHARVPDPEDESTRRKAEHVAPEEFEHAVYWLVRDAHTIEQPDVVRSVARIFGWNRSGPDITAAVDDAIERLIAGEWIVDSGGGSLRVSPE